MSAYDRYDPFDLMWASVKYEELMQRLFQNLILIESGAWAKPLHACNEQEARLYDMRRAWLIKHGGYDEHDLRQQVVEILRGRE